VSEPYYSQRARNICVSLSTFFYSCVIVTCFVLCYMDVVYVSIHNVILYCVSIVCSVTICAVFIYILRATMSLSAVCLV